MSRGACLTLAVAMTLGAVGFAAIAELLGRDRPAGPWPFYGLGGFCLVVAAACAFPRSRPATLRFIGAVIFVAHVWYAVGTVGDWRFAEAVLGLIVWGLPSGYLAVRGAWPEWGRWADALDGDDLDDAEPDEVEPER